MGEVYVSVDIEASGPLPGKHSMLAIGACVVGAPDRSFYSDVRPISDAAVEEAMRVVGRPLSEFQSTGQEPREVMLEMRQWLASVKEDDALVFVGFNATFDWAFVNWYFLTYVGENPFGVGGLDIKSYYMALAGVTWADTRSSRILPAFKGTQRHSHHALQDAMEQAAMFERMIQSRTNSARRFPESG
jgi:ribonuclease T